MNNLVTYCLCKTVEKDELQLELKPLCVESYMIIVSFFEFLCVEKWHKVQVKIGAAHLSQRPLVRC